MLYLTYKIALFVLNFVTHNIAYSVASFFAKVKYYLSKKDRGIVKKNLRGAIPEASEKEISSLAKEVFVNFGKYLVDFFSLQKREKDYLKNTVHIIGIENIKEALRLGKGCIIMAGHFGNWELGGCALASLGYKINIIALAHADRRINDLFMERRKAMGINIIPTGHARTACLEALHRGEIIAILGDRPYGDRGIEVKFFSKTAIVPRGAALLSLKKGSPIVACSVHKKDITKKVYDMVLEKPFLIKRGEEPLGMQLKEITRKFLERFECYIKKYPTQWYMFNKVWEDD